MNKDDPFKDDEVIKVEVLDVRDGYVQFRYLDSGHVSSMRKLVFLAGDAELVGQP